MKVSAQRRQALSIATASILLAAALGGCGDATGRIASAANDARGATERMAERSRADSRRREQFILPNADAIHHGARFELTERYEIREGPDGFMVYDTQTHQIARIGNDTQFGKTLEQAEEAREALTYAASRGQ